MPIEQAIWKVDDTPVCLTSSRLSDESVLEEMIVKEPAILSSEWMLIGRQVQTAFGGIIDLLAIAPDGSLVVIELKRNKTPRDIVAQSLDYASWVDKLGPEKISQIYSRFNRDRNLSEDFRKRFSNELDEDTLNQSHQIVVVAAKLDSATERIINYLNARDIAINVLCFQVFQWGSEQFISRAWMIDPSETQANVASASASKSVKEPWNGEYYVSFGDENGRSWEDAMKYGYISAGGGTWYSQTLKMLSPGDRVWVRIPKTGYVGVGIVTEAMQSSSEFRVMTPEGEKPCFDVLKHGEQYRNRADNPEKAEYFVRVKWLDTVPLRNAKHEVGFFGNQNTVCQPNTPSWRHTVDRLKVLFPKCDDLPKLT